MDDPYFVKTSALLHMDGANNSTIVKDSSPLTKTFTVVNQAKISTAQSKFGGSSAYFDGSSDGIYCVNPAFAFNYNDFTIECFVYLINGGHGSAWARIFETRSYRASPRTGGIALCCQLSENPARLYLDINYTGGISTTTYLTNNTWYHVACVRQDNVFKIFLNGILENQLSTTINLDKYELKLGSNYFNNAESFYGYIDEFRITNYARYTSDFSVPTEAFPDTQDLTCSGFLCSPELKTCNPAKISGPSQGFLCNPSLKTYNSEDGGNYYVDGYITLDTNSISIKVYLFSLNNGRVIQEVKSNPLTGYYRFNNLKYQDYYIWCEKNLKPISRLIINNQLLRY